MFPTGEVKKTSPEVICCLETLWLNFLSFSCWMMPQIYCCKGFCEPVWPLPQACSTFLLLRVCLAFGICNEPHVTLCSLPDLLLHSCRFPQCHFLRLFFSVGEKDDLNKLQIWCLATLKGTGFAFIQTTGMLTWEVK